MSNDFVCTLTSKCFFSLPVWLARPCGLCVTSAQGTGSPVVQTRNRRAREGHRDRGSCKRWVDCAYFCCILYSLGPIVQISWTTLVLESLVISRVLFQPSINTHGSASRCPDWRPCSADYCKHLVCGCWAGTKNCIPSSSRSGVGDLCYSNKQKNQ